MSRDPLAPEAHLEWGTRGYAPVRQFIGPLTGAMSEGGCPAVTVDYSDGLGLGGWRQHTDRILKALFP